MDKARSMLLKSNAPKSLWNEAVSTTNYLVNRLKSKDDYFASLYY